MRRFRVECNYGSKYFDTAVEAFSYFEKCKKRNRNVTIWAVDITLSHSKRISAVQEMLDYSLPKVPNEQL